MPLLRAAAGLFLIPVLAGAASAGAGRATTAQATYGIAPATHGKADSRGLIHVVSGAGVVLHDEVVVQNASTFPITLDVYPSDATTTSDGQFALSPAATAPVDAGSWITLDQGLRRVTLPARGPGGPSTRAIPLTLRIPHNATPGDHAAGIVASLSSKAVSPTGQRVTLLQRVGTRVYIRVGGALRPRLQVEGLEASYVDTWNPIGAGHARVRFVLRNTGNVKLGGRLRVRVSGWWGPERAVSLPSLPLLLPGAAVPETVLVDGVYPAFRGRASVRVEATAAAGDADPRVAAVEQSVAFDAIPWSALICLVGAVVAWWLLRLLRRRRRPPSQETDGAIGPPPPPPVRTPVGAGWPTDSTPPLPPLSKDVSS